MQATCPLTTWCSFHFILWYVGYFPNRKDVSGHAKHDTTIRVLHSKFWNIFTSAIHTIRSMSFPPHTHTHTRAQYLYYKKMHMYRRVLVPRLIDCCNSKKNIGLSKKIESLPVYTTTNPINLIKQQVTGKWDRNQCEHQLQGYSSDFFWSK